MRLSCFLVMERFEAFVSHPHGHAQGNDSMTRADPLAGAAAGALLDQQVGVGCRGTLARLVRTSEICELRLSRKIASQIRHESAIVGILPNDTDARTPRWFQGCLRPVRNSPGAAQSRYGATRLPRSHVWTGERVPARIGMTGAKPALARIQPRRACSSSSRPWRAKARMLATRSPLPVSIVTDRSAGPHTARHTWPAESP